MVPERKLWGSQRGYIHQRRGNGICQDRSTPKSGIRLRKDVSTATGSMITTWPCIIAMVGRRTGLPEIFYRIATLPAAINLTRRLIRARHPPATASEDIFQASLKQRRHSMGIGPTVQSLDQVFMPYIANKSEK